MSRHLSLGQSGWHSDVRALGLVVGNPPHFSDRSIGELRFFDERWSLHRDFFADVDKFLKPGGMIVVVENNHGSTAETFRSMIDEAGLCTVFVRNCEVASPHAL